MSCDICCEKLNNSTRKNVRCNYCEASCCKMCFQKYLLEKIDNHCMNCKKIFSFDFIDQNCSKTFINGELKKHRENVLLEQQKAMIPETQPYVEQVKMRMVIDQRIKEIESKKGELEKVASLNKSNQK